MSFDNSAILWSFVLGTSDTGLITAGTDVLFYRAKMANPPTNYPQGLVFRHISGKALVADCTTDTPEGRVWYDITDIVLCKFNGLNQSGTIEVPAGVTDYEVSLVGDSMYVNLGDSSGWYSGASLRGYNPGAPPEFQFIIPLGSLPFVPDATSPARFTIEVTVVFSQTE